MHDIHSEPDSTLPSSLDVLVVTGMSGAGKTYALKCLEDAGYGVLDNIPLSLCQPSWEKKTDNKPMAIGMDIRTWGFDPQEFYQHIQQWRQKARVTVLFLDAQDDVLFQRYRETRRLHPLGSDPDILSLIQKERRLLAPLMEKVDCVLDTSGFSPPELKHCLWHHMALKPSMAHIYVMSFAYRNGIPTVADSVMDMRFLPNPFYQPHLKALSGQSQEIEAFFQQQTAFTTFIQSFTPLVSLWLSEPRPSFLWAFGCTGGKHRSVYTAQAVGRMVQDMGYGLTIHHRDLAR